ncbi:hypothetical protein [Streptomyces adustus]|uniref:hypothetical protein n=1 Tax=Streptomyces adustus TaxID=1609272 RepID=UPI001391F2C7|nr:hypothetical protein [Streptomyces adustus]
MPLPVIVDALWHEDPPATAVNVIHRHVAALRRLLEPDLRCGIAHRQIQESSLEADALVHIADAHRAAGRTDSSARALRQAVVILEGIGHPDADGDRGRLTGHG